MSRNFAVLPCNGLDKCVGCISREIALKLVEESESEIICPVLFTAEPIRYYVLYGACYRKRC